MTKLRQNLLVAGVLTCILYGFHYFISHEFLIPPSVNSKRLQLFMIVAYIADIVAIFGVYVWLLKSVLQQPIEDKSAIKLLWLFPAIICAAFLFGKPVFSEDLWAYLSSGYFSNLPNGNTYLYRAGDIARFPIARDFETYGILPTTGVTPYGPVWSLYEMLVMYITQYIPLSLILLKAGISAAIFGSAFLICDTVNRLEPSRKQFGTFAFLWNPLILIEIASEGHNDIWMIFLLLLTLNFAIRKKPIASITALWIGVLFKFIPIVYLLALVVYFWQSHRQKQERHKFFTQVSIASLACILLTIIVFYPFWIGAQTFEGVLGMRGTSQVVVTFWIERILSYFISAPYPARISTLITDGTFFVFVFWCSFKVKTAYDLAKAYLNISLVYLFVNSKRYWPWYPDTPLSFVAVAGGRFSVFLLVIVPFLTRFVAPISPLRNMGWLEVRPAGYFVCAVGVLIPTFILIGLLFKDFWKKILPYKK